MLLKKQDLKLMDVVLLTIPVDVSINKLLDLLDDINDNTLVIDFGSTKSAICDAVALHSKRGQFLATHPIAGTEYSGPPLLYQICFLTKFKFFVKLKKLGQIYLNGLKTGLKKWV